MQIRITHRIIATNVVLQAMGVCNNNVCIFCKSERDSIQHLFWNCNHVNKFWYNFEKVLNDKCGIVFNLKFSEQLVLFGIDSHIKTDDVFDLILLLAKQYIYSCRFNNSLPTVDVFLKRLKYRYEIELYNAKIRQEVNNFNTKWIFIRTYSNNRITICV